MGNYTLEADAFRFNDQDVALFNSATGDSVLVRNKANNAYKATKTKAIYLSDGGFTKQYDVMTLYCVVQEYTNNTTNWSTKGVCAWKPLLSHFKYFKAVGYIKIVPATGTAAIRALALDNVLGWVTGSGEGTTTLGSWKWVESGWGTLTGAHAGFGVQIRRRDGTGTVYIHDGAVILSSKNF